MSRVNTAKNYIKLDFRQQFNNQGFTKTGLEAEGALSFGGSSLPAEYCPKGLFEMEGVPYELFVDEPNGDNIELEGQTIFFGKNMYKKIHILGASNNGDFYESIQLVNDDQFIASYRVHLTDFVSREPKFGNRLAVEFPYINNKIGELKQFIPKIWCDSITFDQPLEFNCIKFGDNPSMHIFSITLEY
ncbi:MULTISPECIES: hypothetical protein [Bacillus cereus group]|uniref:hypothetical protein n=1 Tax=Bacillus cereus group TaxID=86661 RepID=UPI002D77156B|nr:hypothetical protein [Bacillus cereus]